MGGINISKHSNNQRLPFKLSTIESKESFLLKTLESIANGVGLDPDIFAGNTIDRYHRINDNKDTSEAIEFLYLALLGIDKGRYTQPRV
jgi:hypothetical protein